MKKILFAGKKGKLVAWYTRVTRGMKYDKSWKCRPKWFHLLQFYSLWKKSARHHSKSVVPQKLICWVTFLIYKRVWIYDTLLFSNSKPVLDFLLIGCSMSTVNWIAILIRTTWSRLCSSELEPDRTSQRKDCWSIHESENFFYICTYIGTYIGWKNPYAQRSILTSVY
jgi:hypothetical protein